MAKATDTLERLPPAPPIKNLPGGVNITPAQLIAAYERVWPQIKQGIPAAQVEAAHLLTSPLTITDFDRIHRKSQRGWLEHAGGIMQMDTDTLLVEARNELDDLLVYLAFRTARLAGRV